MHEGRVEGRLVDDGRLCVGESEEGDTFSHGSQDTDGQIYDDEGARRDITYSNTAHFCHALTLFSLIIY